MNFSQANDLGKLNNDNGVLLIVDDTPDNLRLLFQILSEHGYRVRIATSGAAAFETMRANPPDLILLDIMMPDMNGYQVCQRIKADEQMRDIPVIFLSILESTQEKIRAFEAGGVDYITKPFQTAEVLARVTTHMTLCKLQRELESTNCQLERQVQELEAFAHTVAHDLKSPLGTVAGYIELLAQYGNTMTSEDWRRVAQSAATCVRKTTTIVDSLLLLASTNKICVELCPLDMASIVNEAIGRLASTIEECKAEIILPPAWPIALGHTPWVEEVWMNYLSNAFKYGGKPPRVELGYTMAEGELQSADLPPGKKASEIKNQPPGICFWVRDNGRGLTEEERARLFTPFERLGQARVQGHGLGLSIARRIVEKLGGQTGVESAPEQGCLFYFTLPAAGEDGRLK